MKTITVILCLLTASFYMPQLQAQEETNPEKIERLEQQKEQIITEEKEALRKTVESINIKLENNEITREEADRLKEEAAKKHALNIENRIAILENELAWLLRNEDEKEESSHRRKHHKEERGKKIYYRTTTHLLLAAGFNNALESGQSINDTDFKPAGSRFFEIGMVWKTRVFENSNWLRLRYGVSFQFNGLKPTDNRIFIEEGENTFLEEYTLDLDKSKFRMDNLVVPVHFEFGPSRRVDTDSKTWFSTSNKLKIGLGGFAGFNIGERQKLKYEENGEKVKRKLKGDYNTNDLVYGLSGYMGWGSSALYVKYDLNPIFKNPNPELHNISVGLRFDVE
ncbi:hypothetical protein FK178_09145 [Antarcticibacterium arcticum]|uniref:Outer membrane protein beta-barrel domain-containing protein n=1 Tax=Antarcticibacterium arcticum TaxID=2585771 RepID=A0A5B8YPR3_9FLAO|nr:hypothetical protein [Antarcticibacterium arcticum]QED37879.1 hypothetical protein FK178_09145 [Antarcticibacterium arcticum]